MSMRTTPISRNISSKTGWHYCYGFNGKDRESEFSSGAYDFGARIHDARLGRWMSVDPEHAMQADQSTYKSFLNSPIIFIDPDGTTEWITTYVTDANGTTIKHMEKVSDDIMTDGSVKEVSTIVMGLEVAKHLETNYYDFETIHYIKINSDGTITERVEIKILYGFKRETKWVAGWGDMPKWGETKDPDGFNEGPGEQAGGFWLVSKDGGADPTKLKQVKTLSDAEMRNVEDLITALDKGVRGSLSRPKKGDDLNTADFLNHLFGIIEEGQNLFKKEGSKNQKSEKVAPKPDSVNVNFIKVTETGHHFSSKNVAVSDTVGGVVAGDKTEIITKVNK